MVRVATFALCRSAGLTWPEFQGIFSRELAAIICELDNLAAQIQQKRVDLCSDLFSAVHDQRDPGVRRLLLALKRAIHGERFPSRLRDSSVYSIWSDRNPELSSALRHWEMLVERRACLMAAGQHMAEAGASEYAPGLVKVLREHRLRIAVNVAQPDLPLNWAADVFRGGRSAKRRRNSELMALAYIQRMATKTTPFSYFTLQGVIDLNRQEDSSSRDAGNFTISKFNLSLEALQLIAFRLRLDERLVSGWPLIVNQTVWHEDDQVHFLRSEPSLDSAVGLDRNEAVVVLPRSMIVEFICDAVSNCPYVYTVRTLCEFIVCCTQLPTDRVQKLIHDLIECGFLIAGPRYDSRDMQAIRSIAEAIDPEAGLECNALSTISSAMRQLNKRASRSSSDAVLGAIDRVKTALSRIVDPGSESGECVTGIPLVQHSCVYAQLRGKPREYPPQLETHLSTLLDLLPAFNALLPIHTAVQTACGLGSGMVIPFFHDLWTSGFRLPDLNDDLRGDRIVKDAADCRKGILRQLHSYVASAADYEIVMPDQALRPWQRMARGLAPRTAPLSACFMGHFARREGCTRFVLNRVFPGLGTMFANSADASAAYASQGWLRLALEKQLTALPDGAEAVELVASFGNVAQIRPPITSRCLIYPGEPLPACLDNILPWSDLSIRYDADLGASTLVTASSGRRIVPLHLGTASPLFMPPLYQFILAFGACLLPNFSIVESLEGEFAPQDPNAICFYPRLVLGDVIVSRATWRVPASNIPLLEQHSDFQYFLKLRSWAREAGFPRYVFVTALRAIDYTSVRETTRANRLRKPFLVDWENYACHLLFKKYTRSCGPYILISEMNPPPDELLHDRVTEHAIEVYES